MKSACGICGRMEEESRLIEQPYGWPAVCKECVGKIGGKMPAAKEPSPTSRIVPPFTLVEAADSVAFWVKLIAVINIVAGIVMICAGCQAITNDSSEWPLAIAGAASFAFGIALLAVTKWFMLYNMTLQDIGQRVRLNLPKEAKRPEGSAASPGERP